MFWFFSPLILDSSLLWRSVTWKHRNTFKWITEEGQYRNQPASSHSRGCIYPWPSEPSQAEACTCSSGAGPNCGCVSGSAERRHRFPGRWWLCFCLSVSPMSLMITQLNLCRIPWHTSFLFFTGALILPYLLSASFFGKRGDSAWQLWLRVGTVFCSGNCVFCSQLIAIYCAKRPPMREGVWFGVCSSEVCWT